MKNGGKTEIDSWDVAFSDRAGAQRMPEISPTFAELLAHDEMHPFSLVFPYLRVSVSPCEI